MFVVTLESAPARASGDSPRRVADLITATAAVAGDAPIKAVVQKFEQEAELDSLAVLAADRIAFISRARFFRELGSKFGFAVFENRPVLMLAEEASIVEAD